MSILEIIILGIVQGIAEFLPISSSAHLIIFRNVFGIGAGMPQDMELAFDIALHFGTLLSIIVFFLEDFLKVVGDGLTKGTKTKEGRLFWNLIIATIPAAIFGVLFEDIIEDFVRDKYILIAIALAFMGIIIYICDMKGKQKKDVYKVDKKDLDALSKIMDEYLRKMNGMIFSMGTSFPSNPKNGKNIHLNLNNRVLYAYTSSAWKPVVMIPKT